ncbi:hypothetical protein [Pseudoduganella lutea]|uniref:Uncharacterized protein n=1 Tax=Pseudoduganella lutea TaxID=321985 RepID=A0A4V0Z3X1_9BURK|nr:hypothetical protein [Pseudoduganella lutea]QBE64923.1 hypothetical protein EWM63_19590 [Pseudoduganella lutea]
MLLDYLKADIAEMIELSQKIENYDATLAASHSMGSPITPADAAHAERSQRGRRLAELRDKWGV